LKLGREELYAEFAEGAEYAEKRSWTERVVELAYMLPRSLRSVAGAPNCGAEEKPGHSGRDDRVQRREKRKRRELWRWIVRAHPYKPRVAHPQVYLLIAATGEGRTQAEACATGI
jgi:hypothetical protein